MRPKSRAKWVAFRRAVWASVALHAVAVFAGVYLLSTVEQSPAEAGIDTRAADDAQVRISQSEVAIRFEPPAPAPAPAPAPQPTAPAPQPEPPATTQPAPSLPLATSRGVPQTLPPELIALLRKPGASAVGGAVVEVPVPAGASNPPVADPNVRTASGTNAKPSAPAIHGALKPGQTVVYVLDASGSMGAAGKLDAARAALVATLTQQVPTVRFQVIVYAGTAKPLLATDGNALPASEANVRAAAEKLAALEARGNSDHYGAVRAALAFRPDVILMLTDADDLSTAVLKSLAKTVPISLGQVTGDGVKTPRLLR